MLCIPAADAHRALPWPTHRSKCRLTLVGTQFHQDTVNDDFQRTWDKLSTYMAKPVRGNRSPHVSPENCRIFEIRVAPQRAPVIADDPDANNDDDDDEAEGKENEADSSSSESSGSDGSSDDSNFELV